MKTIKGLEKIYQSQPKRLTADTLAACLLTDLAQCHCAIYGLDSKEQPVLLARLHLVPETLVYDQFDKRIDLIVAGTIVSAEYVPLRYCLQGHEFAMTGRCSVIGKICGV